MYYIFVNPASRSGKGALLWKRTKAYLEQKGIAYELHYTKHNTSIRPEFEEIVKKDLERPIKLMVLGGDGTLNLCLNGITDLNLVELYHIPTGSGNDFIRTKKLPKTLEEQIDSLLQRRHVVPIDVGTVEVSNHGEDAGSYRFIVSSGIGYDAMVCHEVNTSKIKPFFNKIKLGKLVYLFIGTKNVFGTTAVDMELSVDGTTRFFPKVFFLAAMNQPYEGGGLAMNPDASDTDGQLSFCIFYGMSKLKALLMIPKIYGHKHVGKRGVALFNANEIHVTPAVPCMVHYDGECPGVYANFCAKLNQKITFVY